MENLSILDLALLGLSERVNEPFRSIALVITKSVKSLVSERVQKNWGGVLIRGLLIKKDFKVFELFIKFQVNINLCMCKLLTKYVVKVA